MAAIAITEGAYSGAPVALQATSGGGDTLANDGRTVLVFDNPTGGAATHTIESPGACSHGFTHPVTVNVAAGTREVAGPFPVDRFGSTLTVSGSSPFGSTNVGAYRLPG